MDVEELHSDVWGELQPALLGAGDMEAVEALMSMTKHWETRGSRLSHCRPLTPSSDCSEDDAVPFGSATLRDSLTVRDLFGLLVVRGLTVGLYFFCKSRVYNLSVQ